jgi:hypothetical protein
MTNRSGHVGHYREFAPVRLTREQIVARMLDREARDAEEDGARVVARLGRLNLVRYRLLSRRLEADHAAIGDGVSPAFSTMPTPPISSAVSDLSTGRQGRRSR